MTVGSGLAVDGDSAEALAGGAAIVGVGMATGMDGTVAAGGVMDIEKAGAEHAARGVVIVAEVGVDAVAGAVIVVRAGVATVAGAAAVAVAVAVAVTEGKKRSNGRR
jgi:hypothetical protein